MALQTSGLISMAQINQELGRSSTGQISLNVYSSNGVAVVQVGTGTVNINQCSTLRPNTTAPTSITEWYGYNHTAICGSFTLTRFDADTLVVNVPNTVAGQQYEFNFREYLTDLWFILKDNNVLSINPSNPYLFTVAAGVTSFSLFVNNDLFINRVMEARIRIYTNGVPGNWSTVVQES